MEDFYRVLERKENQIEKLLIQSEKFQEQMDRLIAIIESLTDKRKEEDSKYFIIPRSYEKRD